MQAENEHVENALLLKFELPGIGHSSKYDMCTSLAKLDWKNENTKNLSQLDL